MSALPKSKKKKILIILSQLSPLVRDKVENDVENSAGEQIIELNAMAYPCLYNIPEVSWTTEHHDAWAAIEAIYNVFSPEAVGDPSEQTLQDLADALFDKLGRL